MDPGYRRDLAKVYYRNKVTGDFGDSTELQFLGEYWCQLSTVTRSLFYSGSEKLDNRYVYVRKPGVRIMFDIDFFFDPDKVEFYIDGEVYVPYESPLRIFGSGSKKVLYNCEHHAVARLPFDVEGQEPGSGSGSGSGS